MLYILEVGAIPKKCKYNYILDFKFSFYIFTGIRSRDNKYNLRLQFIGKYQIKGSKVRFTNPTFNQTIDEEV